MSEENFKRNFRFPAFSDEAGVKLPLPTRHLFEKKETEETPAYHEPISNRNRDAAEPRVRTRNRFTEPDEPQENESAVHRHFVDETADETRPAYQVPPTDYATRSHRSPSATYSGTPFSATPPEFGKTRKERYHSLPEKRTMPLSGHQPESFNKSETPTTGTGYSKPADRYQGRSYFVPKYVPASLIQDEVHEGPTDAEILASMKKPAESYLGFKQGEDAEPDVIAESLTPEVNVAKDVVPNVETPKKKTALDKSLGGILQEDQAQVTRRNRYFEE